ncbi:MAG: molybdopterin-containing oxidoreductase family protein [Planctomycetota bacterium]
MPESHRVIRTVSPRAGYGADIILAKVEDGRLVEVSGDPDDRVGRGELTPFARRYVERVYSKERLLQPLGRIGERGEGKFEPITWDQAIERIAGELSRISRELDPRALLYYSGHGQDGVMTQFGTLLLSYFGGHSSLYGDLCNAAGMEAARLTFGALHHHPPEDYAHSKMLIVWGKNPAVTNPHQMRFIAEAREKGAYVACVDPVRTKTAKGCDEHLAPRPGTDGFLANSIAHVLIEEKLYDKKFVKRHVHGFEDYRWLVRNYEPSKAELTCGVPAERIVEFARRYGESRPANMNVGFGVQRYRNAGQTVRAIAALQAITGNVGVSGGGFDYFNQAAFVTRPYPFKIPAPPRVRQIGAVSRFGRAVLTAMEPPIKAAIIERANPMAQIPYTPAVHYALTRLDFVCVIDQFLTDTARRADLVLPAKTMFEELDIHPGIWHGILHLKQKCIDPPGEVKTEREIYRAIAERLGYPTDQFEIDPEELINRVLPPGLSVNRLRKQAFDRRGPEFIPFSDRKFPTPSGKIELRSEAAEVSWNVDPLPFYAPPRESPQSAPERFKKFPLHLITSKSEHRFLSQWAHDEELCTKEGKVRIRMSHSDAAARGIEDGETARVFNDRGEAKLPVELDDGVQPGVVVLPQGRWISRDGLSANVFTHDDITDMGYGAILFDCLVEVEKPEE